jgi:hypothetical protein
MKAGAATVLGILALAAMPTALAQGASGKARVVKSDVMTGYQETIAPGTISSTGTGEFVAEIDDEAETITYTLTYSDIEGGAVLFAHIHFGARGTTGGVSTFLCGGGTKPAPCPTPGGTVTGVIFPTDIQGPAAQGIEAASFAELVRAMRSGVTYVNVHSTRFPGGEIRGQVHDHNERQVK